VALGVAVLGATWTVAEPRASSFTLANGMQVVVVPDHRVPVLAHMLWYRVGAADDPSGTSGIAHFLEHLMFKSTSTMPSGEYAKRLAGLGGRGNAQTNYDTTVYFQRISKDNLRAVMELEADRMVNLKLLEEEVRTERDVILEERRSTVDANATRILGEQMQAALYLNHPYHRPRLGWADEMAKLTREDAVTFYKRYYVPNNALLVVVGDTTADSVRSFAQATYGRISPRDSPVRSRAAEPEPVAARRVSLIRAGTPTFLRYYQVPSRASGDPGIGDALDLLAQVLGGDETSRLYRSLVADNLATATNCDYIGGDRDSGRMVLVVVPANKTSFDRIEAIIDREVGDIRKRGISQEELDRAKTAFVADGTFDADDLLSLARRYGEGLAAGRSIEDIEGTPERIGRVTVDDIKRAADQFLIDRASVSGTVTSPPLGRATANDKK
jgi:zinc protease